MHARVAQPAPGHDPGAARSMRFAKPRVRPLEGEGEFGAARGSECRMLPDIDSLALLVRAAELRSLTKAAEASHIGLAAASCRIALFEHRFNGA